MSIQSIVPEHIRGLTPYPPGKPLSELARELGVTSAIKLASNENAFGPSPLAQEAMQASLSELHRYPDGGAFYLKNRLAQSLNVDSAQLMLGNGSNELIELLIRTFGSPEHGVLTSETTFVVYRLISTAAGIPFRAVPMKDLTFDLDAIADAIDTSTRMIFLCNPNNPTGTRFSREALDRFVDRIGDEPILVLDQAYVEFVSEADRIDAFGILARRPRTVILRTFSKAYGLAGARVGYGISHPELVDYVNRVRQPFNVNLLGQVGARAALDDETYLQRIIDATNTGLDLICDALRQLDLTPVPSFTNFVLFDCHRVAKPIYDALLKEGVIVRPMHAYGLPNHLRVNVGTEAENERFLSTLRRVLSAL
ncbi:MAG: histidinol-phosphate transaminase [Myxococcota bacterium]|nr:histidinol-phosphate transaminase [Myxococcota bacterium]